MVDFIDLFLNAHVPNEYGSIFIFAHFLYFLYLLITTFSFFMNLIFHIDFYFELDSQAVELIPWNFWQPYFLHPMHSVPCSQFVNFANE